MCVCRRVCVDVCVDVCALMRVCAHVWFHVRVFMCVCSCVRVCMCMSAYVCMCICLFFSLSIFIKTIYYNHLSVKASFVVQHHIALLAVGWFHRGADLVYQPYGSVVSESLETLYQAYLVCSLIVLIPAVRKSLMYMYTDNAVIPLLFYYAHAERQEGQAILF